MPPNQAPLIADYAFIGDTRTGALVSSDGAIDWLCVPRFDGDPLFARLVGGPRSGAFRVGPAQRARLTGRRYHLLTATVATTWETEAGRLTLTEAMGRRRRRSPAPRHHAGPTA
jgi:GH15 family glucan-1,4-alpha-glucosidase